MACDAGHSFDIAAAGYVNLLQPQDRRSQTAGDSRAATEARHRLLAGGVGRHVLDHVATVVRTLTSATIPVVVDLGCGSGEFLGILAGMCTVRGVGIDLSTAAATLAARSHADVTWVVANADRRLPLLDASTDVVVSIQGRRNPDECSRVLTPGGFLVVAVPAANDLIELREALFGRSLERDRVPAVVAQHQPAFTLRAASEVRASMDVSREQVVDLMTATYRGARRALDDSRAAIGGMALTVAADVLVFERVSGDEPRRP